MLNFSIPAAPELGVRATLASPVIVASDGRTQSDAALAVGRLIAGSPEALRLVTVLPPVPWIPEAQMTIDPDAEAARRAAARRGVIDQARRVYGDETDAELMEGDPATAIGRLAHKIGATMIVCGIGRHRVTDRVFGDETALRFIRVADVPVLAVADRLRHAPRRIVVAVDFSETSLRAARVALDLAAPGASVHLAHVAPRSGAPYDWEASGSTYKEDAGNALHRVYEQLRIPRGMTVQEVMLQGDPATELLAFAASLNADLIATGSHGRGFVGRILIGSVTTRIVRCSTCSVLTVPHSAVMTHARTTGEPPTTEVLREGSWAPELAEFTRKNAGRRGTLEIDEPAIDAQAQAFDFPLLGVDWDPHGDVVEIMLGNSATEGPHLTHSVAGVTSIGVVRDDRGRDLGLRIAHGAGLALFTLSAPK